MGHVISVFSGSTIVPSTGLPVIDSFNRADNASSLGTADSGHVWTAINGTWGIASNQGRCVSTTTDPVAVVETGASDVTVEFTLAAIDDGGVAFRVADNNNYLEAQLNAGPSRVQVWRKQSGSFTQLASVALGTAPANGDVIKVVLIGSSIEVFRNGVSVLSTTSAFNQSVTRHGIYLERGGSTCRIDSFSIV